MALGSGISLGACGWRGEKGGGCGCWRCAGQRRGGAACCGQAAAGRKRGCRQRVERASNLGAAPRPLRPRLHQAGELVGKNLVPATLGNIIGGAAFVGTAYALSFGSPGHAGERARAWGRGAGGRPPGRPAGLPCPLCGCAAAVLDGWAGWRRCAWRQWRQRSCYTSSRLLPLLSPPPSPAAVFSFWDGMLAAGGCTGSRRRAADAATRHPGDAGRHSLANGAGHHASHMLKLPTMPRVDENGAANGASNGV